LGWLGRLGRLGWLGLTGAGLARATKKSGGRKNHCSRRFRTIPTFRFMTFSAQADFALSLLTYYKKWTHIFTLKMNGNSM